MTLFGNKNLEEKVGEASKGIFKTVRICEEYRDIAFSAPLIWKYFSENGKIENIGSVTNYKNEIEGSPLMQRSEDGQMYPASAFFESNLENTIYRVSFGKGVGETLSVTVECPIEKSESINEVLSKAKKEVKAVISISKKYCNAEPMDKLYQFLIDKSDSIKIVPLNYNTIPKFVVNNNGYLSPSSAKIISVLDGTTYAFNFSQQSYEKEVDVECPPDKISFINDILESVCIKKTEEGETEVRGVNFSVSVKDYNWKMVGGLGAVKEELQKYIEWPLENPELFSQMGCAMPKGILLHGPPGNGKTTIAKILANESNSTFYSVSPKDINNMYVGNTEKNWGELFSNARKDVKNGKTVIIFIDEIDGFFTNRDDMDKYSRISFGQFAQEMDGISDLEKVVVIAATNCYDSLDPALIRPGRFTKKICIENPNNLGRKEILDIYMEKKSVSPEVSIEKLVGETDGYSGAQLKELCDSAAFSAIERYSAEKKIEIKDIEKENIKEIIIEPRDFERVLNEEKTRQSSAK
jgi:ATP-dependent 26S proteasome regulatory subunit